MRRIVLSIGLLFALTIAAAAQGCGQQNPNCIVPTAPPGTSNNQAASTAFVQSAAQAPQTPLTLGANGGSAGQVLLNGSTSGSTNVLANSTGGLSIQPTLGQGLFLDDASNSVLQVLGVGNSAVNGLYVKNATTGNPAIIGAVGSDSNIGIQLIAKGSSGNLGFQIINAGGTGILVPMQAGGTSSGTGEVVLSGNTSGSLSMVGTPTGGHVALASSSIPTLSGCSGTGSALFGTDTVGAVTATSTPTPTTCTVTFGTAYTNPPFCVVSGETAPPTSYNDTASALTVNFTGAINYKFVFYCFGL